MFLHTAVCRFEYLQYSLSRNKGREVGDEGKGIRRPPALGGGVLEQTSVLLSPFPPIAFTVFQTSRLPPPTSNFPLPTSQVLLVMLFGNSGNQEIKISKSGNQEIWETGKQETRKTGKPET